MVPQTLLTVGRPISQLAYVEVHLHVQPDNHVRCELIRVSQHSKALQALGLQDASPAKPAPKDKDTDTEPQPAEEPAPSPVEAAAAAEQQTTALQPAGVQLQATDQHSSVTQRAEAVQKVPASSSPQGQFRSGSASQQQPQQQQQKQQQQQPAVPCEATQGSAGESSAARPAGLVQRRLRTVSSDMSPGTVGAKPRAEHHRQDASLVVLSTCLLHILISIA